MPGAPTDVPHVSFTHHRIGRHEAPAKPESPPSAAGTLKPYRDYPRLGEADRERSRGLAYLELVITEKNAEIASGYSARAFGHLSRAYSAGLRDPAAMARLSRLHFERSADQALPLAEAALASPDLAGPERCVALFVSAAERLRRGQVIEARAGFRELVTLRRHPDDWLLLAECEKRLSGTEAGFAALEMAVRISPRLARIHESLARYHRQKGDAARAEHHQRRAVP
jgi:hypothetical protein